MNAVKIIKSLNNKQYLNEIKTILDGLADWFGDSVAIENYIYEILNSFLWIAKDNNDEIIGFFALKKHYNFTAEIYVCGICKQYQNKGLGKAMYKQVEMFLKKNGYKYVIVKTLSDIVDYEPYNQTRQFYKSIGFDYLITLREMWDEQNPCLIMIKQI